MDVKSLKCLFVLILYFNVHVEGEIPFGMCANPICSVLIGKGVTLTNYNSPDGDRLSINPNDEVLIFVKEFGAKKDLLGVQVNGIKGYISKSFVRETATFERKLVPAISDFRTPSVTGSDVVTNHIYHSDFVVKDGASTTFVHTVQQSSVSSLHNSINSGDNKHDESLQASHIAPQFPSSDHAHIGLHSHFDYYSGTLNFPHESSHFDLNSGNVLPSSDVTGLRSENFLSYQSQMPDVKHSLHQQDHMLYSSFSQNDLNTPDFKQNSFDYLSTKDFDYGSITPGTSDFSQQASLYQSNFPPIHTYPSYDYDYSIHYNDAAVNEEYAETLAALNKIGLDNTGMYTDSYSDSNTGQSSQNNEMKSDIVEAELKAAPSHSWYHSSVLNSDASFHTNINLNPSISKKNEIFSSETVTDDKDSSNIPSQDYFSDTEIIDHNVIINESNMNTTGDTGLLNTENEINTASDKVVNDLLNEENEIIAEDEGFESDEKFGDDDYDIESDSSDDDLKENINISSFLKPSISVTSHEDTKNAIENSKIGLTNVVQETLKMSGVFISEETPSVKESLSANVESNYFGKSNNADSFISHSEIHSSILQNFGGDVESKDLNSATDDSYDSVTDTFATPTIADEFLNSYLSSQNSPHPENVVSNIPQITQSNILQEKSSDFKENILDTFGVSNQNSELIKPSNSIGIGRLDDDLTSTYQTRNLKGENMPNEDQHLDSESLRDENNTQHDSNFYNPLENGLESIKSIVDFIMSWVPEPLHSTLKDLQTKGISPRVPVFTALCGFFIIFLIVPVYYIKEWSKESKLSAQLANIEKKAYTLSAANIVLEEKLECAQSELKTIQSSLDEERNISAELRTKLEKQAKELENSKSELESYIEELESLKEKESEYISLMNNHDKGKEELINHKNSLEKIIKDQEYALGNLTDQLQESESSLKEIEKENEQYSTLKEDYEEKLAQFEMNCNQLLQEAEVWNLRVSELTSKLNEEKSLKEEAESSLKLKDEEIESLKQLVETFKTFDEIEDSEEEQKTKEEKMQILVKSSMILNQLKKKEEENKILDEQLINEKNKMLEMEVEILEVKSEIDKLKMSYNQALQDKAEAQTKLDVLTNYFKDKEIQLQKQLGAQEAVRQKNEDDVNSAERKICLIEQENASYKYQVASMKQEMEETERNLKSQIAVQEKKAHENWIAARAAERKLEDMKQEVTQLRQRLTLLEREQENWASSSRDEILRPVPKRIPGTNEESGNKDASASDRSMFPPLPNERLPPPPNMMLPPDRPLPPLPPPVFPPMFLHPMERHFRPHPWAIPPDPSSDFRTTPPEFITGRESTPPRGRQSGVTDGDAGPHASSPLTTDTRDSRNSTPPHMLPDFHDVPPQPGRPFFPPPPPLGHPRLPVPPPYRRDIFPGHKRLENPNEYNTRGSQQPPSTSEGQWQHSRV